MSTKLFTITGKSLWAKVFTPDEYNGVENYKISIIPATPKDWNTIKESGLRTKVKKTEDGDEYITLSRPKEGKKNNEGEEFGGGQPLVLDVDKKPMDRLIGNGSDVEVLFATYDTRMGKGHRLETVMVHKLVPYERMEDDENTQGLSWKDRPKFIVKDGVVEEIRPAGPVEPSLPF